MSRNNPLLRNRGLLITSALVLLSASAAAFLYFRARRSEATVRQLITHTLAERLRGDVTLGAIRVQLFPRIAVSGEDLTIHMRRRRDTPPLIHVDHFSVAVGILGLLRPVKHISLVQVDHMTITIPPRESSKDHSSSPPPSREMKGVLDTVADHVFITEMDVLILSRKAGKEPLDWQIHQLVLDSVSA